MIMTDEIIHQSVRLRIMAALAALSPAQGLEFVRLKAISGATDGNLGAHITTLENAGYVHVEKDFVDKKPRTRVFQTKAGRKAFQAHVEFLKSIVDGTDTESTS
ncbi:MAG: transcriptional regulator [Alphaproteobacteria bacterium]|nr:transcriptional regulator [Alphaproteobacteria bacterium]